jgi:hypothetical protein
MKTKNLSGYFAQAAALCCLVTGLAVAQDSKSDPLIDLGKFKLTAPEKWDRVQPKSRIVAHEFAAPAAEDDKQAGRLTVMSAGGSVADNIDRWYGQFKQPDGSSTKEKAKVEKRTIAGQEVHVVDISGTYKDQPGPFAPGVDRENYRMLAAIIVTDDANFFVKFYGPRRTIAAHEKAFDKMVDGLSKK